MNRWLKETRIIFFFPFLSQVNAPVFKKTTLYPRKIYLHYSEGGARNADENFSRDNVLPPINFYAKLVCFFYISRIVRQNVNEIKLARISTAVPHSRHFYPSPPNKREGYRRNFSIIFPSYTRPSYIDISSRNRFEVHVKGIRYTFRKAHLQLRLNSRSTR